MADPHRDQRPRKSRSRCKRGRRSRGWTSTTSPRSPASTASRSSAGDLEFHTDKFILKKGETVTLKVEWFKDGKLHIIQGDKTGEKSRPTPPKGSQEGPYALAFDGMGGYVDLPTVTYAAPEPFTMEGYFQVDLKTAAMVKSGPTHNPMRLFGTFNGTDGISLNVGEDRVMLARIGGPILSNATPSKLDTLWHHLAICFDGKRLAVYKDGVHA